MTTPDLFDPPIDFGPPVRALEHDHRLFKSADEAIARKANPRPPGEARDAGIEVAAKRADRDFGWTDCALAMVETYARACPTLTTEEVRAYAYAKGLPRPPNEHAWGSPMMRARKLGWLAPGAIEPATAERVHCGRVMRWRSTIYRAA